MLVGESIDVSSVLPVAAIQAVGSNIVTVAQTAAAATRAGKTRMSDDVAFGTAAPFDTEVGAHFIPTTISDAEGAVPNGSDREAIFAGNARGVLRTRV